jgi:hypothetical protein
MLERPAIGSLPVRNRDPPSASTVELDDEVWPPTLIFVRKKRGVRVCVYMTAPRKKACISLDSFGRIVTFQWVTANPNKKSFPFDFVIRCSRVGTRPAASYSGTVAQFLLVTK